MIDEADAEAAASFGGKGEPVLHISAVHGDGLPDLLELLRNVVVEPEVEEVVEETRPEVRIALLGRANVGKSTLLNALARDEIALAAATPGVTRDAIEAIIEAKDHRLCLVDTAGVRQRLACDAVDIHAIRATERELRMVSIQMSCYRISATWRSWLSTPRFTCGARTAHWPTRPSKPTPSSSSQTSSTRR